jgi:hypothetical protein
LHDEPVAATDCRRGNVSQDQSLRDRQQYAEITMHHARIGAAFFLIALPLAAFSQTAPPTGVKAPPSPQLKEAREKMRATCAGDAQKFCGGLARGALPSCMREHRAELSAECQSARGELRAIKRKEKG